MIYNSNTLKNKRNKKCWIRAAIIVSTNKFLLKKGLCKFTANWIPIIPSYSKRYGSTINKVKFLQNSKPLSVEFLNKAVVI